MNKLRKTIRFKLETNDLLNAIVKNNADLQTSTNVNQINNLALRLQDLHKTLKSELFENSKILSSTTIKLLFFKTFEKRTFYSFRDEQTKRYPATKIENNLKTYLDLFQFNIEQLIKYLNLNKHEKARKSEINLLLTKIFYKKQYSYFKSLVENINFKNKDKDVLEALIIEIDDLKNKVLPNYLSAKSNGLQILKASLNYYVINKLSNQAYNEQIFINKYNKDIKEYNVTNFNKLLHENIKNWNMCNFKSDYKGIHLNKEERFIKFNKIYNKMKTFKALQKSAFIQALQKESIKSYEDLMQNFNYKSNDKDKTKNIPNILFKNINNELFEKLINAQKKLNHSEKLTKEETTKLKKERGGIIQAAPDFAKFCTQYKEWAMAYGQFKAEIKNVEKEKHESQSIEHWAIFVKENKQDYIALIPRADASLLYNKIRKFNTNEAKTAVTYFESLTFSALKKLCSKTTTYKNEFRHDLQNQGVSFADFDINFKKTKDHEKDFKKIAFYKEVLQKQTTLKSLNAEVIEKIINTNYSKFEDFIVDLEKLSYQVQVKTRFDFINTLKNKYNAKVIKILFSGKKDNQNQILWKQFWSADNADYDVRIDPILSISYREPKQSRIDKYGKNSLNYDNNKTNRYLQEQFTLNLSITENCNTYDKIIDIKTDEQEKQYINEFNKNLPKTNYAFGVDVGSKNLGYATLIHKIGDKFIPVGFEAYQFDDLNFEKNNKKAILNLSYFLNESLYKKNFKTDDFNCIFAQIFKPIQTSHLNLTTAKVICNKLILNGDYSNILNLKILHAKRQIYNHVLQGKSINFHEENWSENFYKHQNEFEHLYFYQNEVLKNSMNKKIPATLENINEELKCYYQTQANIRFNKTNNEQKDLFLLEENINKYRSSLVANMIGVIDFLRKQYGFCIALEELDHELIKSHEDKFHGDITRELQYKLYLKMQNYNLMPNVQNINNDYFKSNKIRHKHKQIGILNFVSEEETSLICPKCGEKAYEKSDDKRYDNDKKMEVFSCNKCGYHNKTNFGEYNLANNDAIAAFNIAKRAFN